MIGKNEDFKRSGSLRSNVTFRWCGEVQSISIRRFVLQERDGETIEKEQWALDITDCFGFKMSYFKKGATREGIELLSVKIPYGQTFLIDGEINVRKGNTFFNAKHFLYPNGEPLVFRSDTEGVDQEEALYAQT